MGSMVGKANGKPVKRRMYVAFQRCGCVRLGHLRQSKLPSAYAPRLELLVSPPFSRATVAKMSIVRYRLAWELVGTYAWAILKKNSTFSSIIIPATIFNFKFLISLSKCLTRFF